MKLRLRDPHARFSPCKIQIPPISTIKAPIRLLNTRIAALNTRRILHLTRTGFECIINNWKLTDSVRRFVKIPRNFRFADNPGIAEAKLLDPFELVNLLKS